MNQSTSKSISYSFRNPSLNKEKLNYVGHKNKEVIPSNIKEIPQKKKDRTQNLRKGQHYLHSEQILKDHKTIVGNRKSYKSSDSHENKEYNVRNKIHKE